MHAPLQESALGKLCFSIARTCSKMLAATPAVTACWLKLAMQGGEGTSSAAYTLPCLLTLSGQCIMLNCLCNFEPRWQVLGSSRDDTRLPHWESLSRKGPFKQSCFKGSKRKTRLLSRLLYVHPVFIGAVLSKGEQPQGSSEQARAEPSAHSRPVAAPCARQRSRDRGKAAVLWLGRPAIACWPRSRTPSA